MPLPAPSRRHLLQGAAIAWTVPVVQAVGAAPALAASGGPPPTTSTLYGVTGNGGTPPETLFSIDTSTGLSTAVATLGNGSDGEALAFRPVDGLLYHASGISDGAEFFETVDPTTYAVGPNLAPGNTYGPSPASEVFALCWYPPQDVFLAGDISSVLFSVTPAGAFTAIATMARDLRGFTYTNGRLLAVDPFGTNMYEIDPATGADVGPPIPITVAGTPTRANGLATDPVTGLTYVVLRGAANRDRNLGIINTVTGEASVLGALPPGMAALTFRFA